MVSTMIKNFVGGGFKISCLYCKTFNIIYPQDTEYVHPLPQPCPQRVQMHSLQTVDKILLG